LLIVVGTRPNFIKVTRFRECAARYDGLDVKIVHTGQHHDAKMADVFFEQFGLTPDFFLNTPAGSPNSQMAHIMAALERTVAGYKPDLLLVVGDVNSTLAAAITANKMEITLAHVESGLRSYDRTMPEEINRILTDEVADIFFVTEQSGLDNLLKEGRSPENIHFVGNTMIDTMVAFSNQIEKSEATEKHGLEKGRFILMTIHRPATVDNQEELTKLLSLIEELSTRYSIVFPVHPRTVNNLKKFGLYERFRTVHALVETGPMDYFSFQKLIADCSFILTDSGGIQEESTFLGKPCITLRPNTERPSTVTIGTNTLVSFEIEKIMSLVKAIETKEYKKGSVPPLWDGHATERVLEALARY
jgi:UDP-N-acetylglucosamine 2-epimerase (non-hydrolysing)